MTARTMAEAPTTAVVTAPAVLPERDPDLNMNDSFVLSRYNATDSNWLIHLVNQED